jgi:hypothetical protein
MTPDISERSFEEGRVAEPALQANQVLHTRPVSTMAPLDDDTRLPIPPVTDALAVLTEQKLRGEPAGCRRNRSSSHQRYLLIIRQETERP